VLQTKAEYICADQPVTSFFACDKAADHTFRIARDSREQRGSVELVRSSNECIGDFDSTEEAFCCPDFRVTTWALRIDPPFAKLIRELVC